MVATLNKPTVTEFEGARKPTVSEFESPKYPAPTEWLRTKEVPSIAAEQWLKEDKPPQAPKAPRKPGPYGTYPYGFVTKGIPQWGVPFFRGYALGFTKATQIPALMGEELPQAESLEEKIGEGVGATVENVIELITATKALKAIGMLPKGMAFLQKAFRTGTIFGTQQMSKEARKAAAEVLHDKSFGYRGGIAALESFAFGAVLSMGLSGVSGIWGKLKPTEQIKALKILGLKKGATLDQINIASRKMALKYHPDKVKEMVDKFHKVIGARDYLRNYTRTAGKDIITRADKGLSLVPRLLEAKPPTVEEFGKYPITKAIKRPPTEAITVPSKPTKPITPKKAVEVAAEVKPSKIREAKQKELQQKSNELATQAYRKILSFKPTGKAGDLAQVLGVQPKKGQVGITIQGTTYAFRKTSAPTAEQVREIESLYKQAEDIQKDIYEYGFAVLEEGQTTGNKKPMQQGIKLREQGLLDKEELEYLSRLERFWQKYPNADYGIVQKDGNILPNKAQPVAKAEPAPKIIPEELRPLIEEAQKYKSAREFMLNYHNAFGSVFMPKGKSIRRGRESPKYKKGLEAWNKFRDIFGFEPGVREGKFVSDNLDAIEKFWELAKAEPAKVVRKPIIKHPELVGVEKARQLVRAAKEKLKAEPAKVEKKVRKPKEFTMAAETTADFPLMSETLLPEKVGGVMKYTKATGTYGAWMGSVKKVGDFLKRFARTVPEFTADPVFVVNKDKMIVYQDGGRFKFKPEAFGIDAKKLIEGDKIRVNLESYGIKVASIARQIAAKKLPLRPPVQIKGKPGFVDVRPLLKVHKTFMGIVEPSKAVEIKLGKEPYAAVIKGIHEVDVGRIEFNEAQIEGQDKSLGQLSEWFNKFPEKDLKNFMISRGEPTTEGARLIQRDAMKELVKELRRGDLFQAVQRIADSNYKYLQSVVGDDIHRVEDYFYGIYKNPKQVDKFLDYWRTTKRFTKEKKLPTVADAIDYGLELRNYNPIENLKAEYIAISHLKGMNWMKDELLRTGKGKFIDDMLEAPIEWDMVNDPVFKDLRLQPDLAKLINNLIATNKITRIPLVNTLREINNVARTIKFIGSAFHLLSVAKQSVADSGYFGFLYKKTALRGFTRGFRTNDPIFRTTAYKDYIRHGGGHRYSVESEARRTFNRAVNSLNRDMGKAVRVGALPLRIPTSFVNWMFQSYIPKVKYSKYLDVVAEREKKLGRILTSPEKIDIIKEGQNFYGMMNERTFGRSGTVTTAMRFYFMSPGYAEGNYRSQVKGATQWGGKGGFNANRSRSNIINSWLITGIAATVGTLAFTGKPPKMPETLDDARDLFKIDTGKTDEKGRKIMIDLMTYDKDYWNVAFNLLRLRPDVAIGKSWKRIGGMKAPTADIIVDLALMSMGKAVYDWKGDRVVEITDPFLLKAMKLTTHEIKKLVPISVSVFQQSKKRDIDTTVAAIETLLGFRPTKTEKDIREQKIISKMYSLAGQREELSYYIGQSTDPKKTVARYNKTVNSILNSPYIPKSMKNEWGPRLLIEYDKVVTWKRFPAGKMTNAEMQRAYDAHTLSVPYKRRGEPFRMIGEPKKGSERRVAELKTEAKKRGIELKRSPRKPPRR